MTTTDAVAAWHVPTRFATTVLVALLGLSLAGCSGSLFGSNDTLTSDITPAQSQPAAAPQTTVAIAPVIGAPEQVGRQLTTELTSAAERQRIGIAKGDKADFTLRGYVVAAKEKAGTKVSYIWDLFDGAGKRANRITGEEIVRGTADGRDPWANVSPEILKKIAEKTAATLGTSLPGPGAAVVSAPAGVGAQNAAPGTQTAMAGEQTTGSIARGAVTAVIPNVTGAPGDGSQALATALQRELSRNGLNVGETAAAGAYRIEGRVSVGQSANGKQPIQIDWQVKDPQGKKLGTVSQKNEIPPGSLDGAWGQTADAAAAAAAQGIIKLLPTREARNTN